MHAGRGDEEGKPGKVQGKGRGTGKFRRDFEGERDGVSPNTPVTELTVGGIGSCDRGDGVFRQETNRERNYEGRRFE
jgi:hypothetical protein